MLCHLLCCIKNWTLLYFCFCISYKNWIIVRKYTSHGLRHFHINLLTTIHTIKSSTQCIYIVIFFFFNMQFFSIIIIYFCCLSELLFISICKLSKFQFLLPLYVFPYNIVHIYFTFIIIFILGSFLHFQFSQNIFAWQMGGNNYVSLCSTKPSTKPRVPTFTLNKVAHFLSSHKMQKMEKTNIWFCNWKTIPAARNQTSTSKFSKKTRKRK
jgi:hypothetical protein